MPNFRSFKRVRLSRRRYGRKRTFSKRRRYTRRRAVRKRSGKISNLVGLGASPFPLVLKTRFIVSSNITDIQNQAAGGELYNLNSLYNPDGTIGTAQPRYFDTLLGASATTAPYSGYRVYKASIYVRVHNTVSVPCAVSFTINRSGLNLPSTIRECYERADTSVIDLGVVEAGNCIKRWKKVVMIAPWWGEKSVLNSDDFIGLYNNSPVNLVQLRLIRWDKAPVANAVPYLDIKIVYHTVLFTRNDVADSAGPA